MSAMQRNKGQRGERELFAMLSDELGFIVKRNVDQAREGGADCIEIPGWAVECKRCEQLSINAWWKQAEEQAIESNTKPILFYRQTHKPWLAIIDVADFPGQPSLPNDRRRNKLAQVSLETACYIIRESLSDVA